MIKIARWLDQREFDLSNDLHDVHVKCLSSLPVLRSIHLTSPAWCGLSDQSHALSIPGGSGNKSWGPTVFRAILLAMYNRIQTSASPIEEFVLKGVTEECMLLPPQFFQKAILGFQNIKTLVISIQNCQDQAEISLGWIPLLGRLMQSATSLESLEIEIPDSIGSIHFSTLASPFKYKSTDQPELISIEQCWPKLKSLKLRDIIFSETHILQFLSTHRRSLRTIHFDNCEIRTPDSSDNSQSEIAYESPPASDDGTAAPRPWSIVLRQIAKHFPPKTSSALDSFRIEQLHHQKVRSMRSCTIQLWQDYISGLADTEPSEDQRHDECCCTSEEMYMDDDSSTGSDVGFWAMPGMYPFGLGDSEEDEELDDTDEEVEFDEEDEEDMELGEGFFIHPPGLHPYPWEWPHAGYQEY